MCQKNVFHTGSVMAFKEQIRFYQLDITENLKEHTDYMAQKKLFGPPSMIFYDHLAQEVGRFQGVPELQTVVSFLSKSL